MIIPSLLALQSQTTLAIICAIWFLRALDCVGESAADISLDAWRRLSTAEREVVEAEAMVGKQEVNAFSICPWWYALRRRTA
jgi:hypothetical protein